MQNENGGQPPTVTLTKAGVQDLTRQWRSLCLEFLDSRLRGNDGLGIFITMTPADGLASLNAIALALWVGLEATGILAFAHYSDNDYRHTLLMALVVFFSVLLGNQSVHPGLVWV